MAEIFDVIVVGAGPSGAIAAAELAKHGLKVLLIDKETFPREKICGGGLVFKSLQLIPEEAKKTTEIFCHTVDLHFANSGLAFTITRHYPIITTVDRKKFDTALVEHACSNGAVFREATKCLEIYNPKEKERYIEIKTPKGRIKSRFLIAADGALSQIGRYLKIPEEKTLIPALEVKVDTDSYGSDKLTARFDFDVCPHGYGWIFPKRNYLSVGILSHRKGAGLKSYLIKYLKEQGIKGRNLSSIKGSLIPVTPRRRFASFGRILFVGDALGWVDPIVAEGLSGAITSARLATEAILRGNMDSIRVKEIYRSKIKKNFLDNFRFCNFLANIVYNYPEFRDICFKLYGQEISEVITDIICGKKSYKWLLMWPPNYVHASFLMAKRILNHLL